jgi:hypothetical protein
MDAKSRVSGFVNMYIVLVHYQGIRAAFIVALHP